MAREYNLESTLRPRGRPKKNKKKQPVPFIPQKHYTANSDHDKALAAAMGTLGATAEALRGTNSEELGNTFRSIAENGLTPEDMEVISNRVTTVAISAGVNRYLNKKRARALAKKMKFKPVKSAPFNSHGQPVFRKGTRYITPDVDSHKGGVWKMFDNKGRRLGTYDADMKRIGK
jgi:hypothetical protein